MESDCCDWKLAKHKKTALHVFGTIWNTEDFNAGVKGIKEQVKILNTHLEGRQWLVGNNVTLADVSNFVSLIAPFALCSRRRF